MVRRTVGWRDSGLVGWWDRNDRHDRPDRSIPAMTASLSRPIPPKHYLSIMAKPLMLALLLSAAASTPALAQDITRDGVTMPGTVDVAGHQLTLNGTALRKKVVVKVYVAGLYLPAKSQDANAILDGDTPRQLRMQFLRDVDKGKMCDAWDDALKNNTPNAGEELKAQFAEVCGYMEDLKKGDVMIFTYVPGTGTTVEVKGSSKGPIAGKEFADALFKAWIGPKPGPGDGFKKNLLGLS